jgi:hypothetical protein
MNKVYLIGVKKRLEELSKDLYIAERTTDKRSREKRIREAKIAISEFGSTFPSDLQGTLHTDIGANPLSWKWVSRDIGKCIEVIERLIEEMPDEEV